MCNTCNTGYGGRSVNTCGCCCFGASLLSALFGNSYGCGCGCNSCGSNWGSQRVCRDSCGNLRIQQRSFDSCACGNIWNGSRCGGCCGTWNVPRCCGCFGGLSASTYPSVNGGAHSCCGLSSAQEVSSTSDCYYARQYGLTNRSGGSCCNLLSSYNV